jgi:hypothetical protein
MFPINEKNQTFFYETGGVKTSTGFYLKVNSYKSYKEESRYKKRVKKKIARITQMLLAIN